MTFTVAVAGLFVLSLHEILILYFLSWLNLYSLFCVYCFFVQLVFSAVCMSAHIFLFSGLFICICLKSSVCMLFYL